MLTGRPKVLVFSYCYHGSVDEAFAVAATGGAHRRARGQRRPAGGRRRDHDARSSSTTSTRSRRRCATGEIACVLAEPAMTNMGIVLPDAGYHEALRALTRAHGTLLIIDETHTFSAGPGGCTAAWGLEPDLLTIGKAIGGGVPCGALGLSARRRGADARRGRAPTTRTPAASAARWPATRSRSRRCGRRSARC